jgi:hypothetical protein
MGYIYLAIQQCIHITNTALRAKLIGGFMKQATKDKYLEELSGKLRMVRDWLPQFPEEEGEILARWQKYKDVENDLLDGSDLDTIGIRNRINAANTSCDTLRRKLFKEDLIDGTGEVVTPVPEPEPTELGAYVMDTLAGIQGQLNELYGMIIDKHPIAATGMPAVDELRTRAGEIGSTMQKIARMAGVL